MAWNGTVVRVLTRRGVDGDRLALTRVQQLGLDAEFLDDEVMLRGAVVGHRDGELGVRRAGELLLLEGDINRRDGQFDWATGWRRGRFTAFASGCRGFARLLRGGFAGGLSGCRRRIPFSGGCGD